MIAMCHVEEPARRVSEGMSELVGNLTGAKGLRGIETQLLFLTLRS